MHSSASKDQANVLHAMQKHFLPAGDRAGVLPYSSSLACAWLSCFLWTVLSCLPTFLPAIPTPSAPLFAPAVTPLSKLTCSCLLTLPCPVLALVTPSLPLHPQNTRTVRDWISASIILFPLFPPLLSLPQPPFSNALSLPFSCPFLALSLPCPCPLVTPPHKLPSLPLPSLSSLNPSCPSPCCLTLPCSCPCPPVTPSLPLHPHDAHQGQCADQVHGSTAPALQPPKNPAAQKAQQLQATVVFVGFGVRL